MDERTTIILSDVHLGWKPNSPNRDEWVHEKKLRAFLDSLEQRPPETLRLVIAGDLADFQRDEPVDGYVRLSMRLSRRLQQLSRHGAEVIWLLGNHDVHLFHMISGRSAVFDLIDQYRDTLGGPRAVRALKCDLEKEFHEGAVCEEAACGLPGAAGEPVGQEAIAARIEAALADAGQQASPEGLCLLSQVREAFRDAQCLRRTIEAQTGTRLAYPFLTVRSGGQRVFITHGDTCDLTLLFAKLEGDCPTALERICRAVAGLQGVRRTDVFGFHEWVYAQDKGSVKEFESFLKQDTDVMAKLVAGFVASEYAREMLPWRFRKSAAAIAGLVVPLLAKLSRLWGPAKQPKASPAAVCAGCGLASLVALLLGILPWVAGPAHPSAWWPAGADRVLCTAAALGIAYLFLFAAGVSGVLWQTHVEEALVYDLETKRANLDRAMVGTWYGQAVSDQADTLRHRVIGHFHYPEQTALAGAPNLTDAGAWVGTAPFYLAPLGANAPQTAPLCTYVEVTGGQVTLYNYVDAGTRWRFVGYQKVAGAGFVRCWSV